MGRKKRRKEVEEERMLDVLVLCDGGDSVKPLRGRGGDGGRGEG